MKYMKVTNEPAARDKETLSSPATPVIEHSDDGALDPDAPLYLHRELEGNHTIRLMF